MTAKVVVELVRLVTPLCGLVPESLNQTARAMRQSLPEAVALGDKRLSGKPGSTASNMTAPNVTLFSVGTESARIDFM